MNRNDLRRACGILGACATFLALASAPAAQAETGNTQRAIDCRQAERDAWFLRQLQRTDGDVDPRPQTIAACSERARAAATTTPTLAQGAPADGNRAEPKQR